MEENGVKKDLLYKALETRRVEINGQIDKEIADQIEFLIKYLVSSDPHRAITLVINSAGGNVDESFRLYKLVNEIETPIIGLVIGKARSMALIVLQACRERLAMADSEIGIHNLVLTVRVRWDEFEEYAKTKIEEIKIDQEVVWHIMAQRSDLPLEIVKQLSQQDTILKAEDAKKLGFVDELVTCPCKVYHIQS